ncbi:hypothetical protein [Aneurinibacillus tyrosinisolvens]|uniref:hypothetical protein n=1 Tax=Aneurinibacillus tyrosinisolvens TaxID=1443435 RepID=UPI000AB368DB|nr:hypothetical protein [Aneurinibacillus tyrosinisolvens]
MNHLECLHTYGFETKSRRIALGLEKSHWNDAFCIAGGSTQKRILPLTVEQVRRNNRSLEKFYDAQFIDIRSGEKASGQDLSSGRRKRNRNLNGENLRKYRGEKLSRGKRTIRKERYPIQPNDLLVYQGKKYTAKGVHNKGSRVILKETGKSVKVSDVHIYAYGKGFKIS